MFWPMIWTWSLQPPAMAQFEVVSGRVVYSWAQMQLKSDMAQGMAATDSVRHFV